MQWAHRDLGRTPGLGFYKLMGSGRGLGFNPLPDWGTYALLAVWNSADAARRFHHESDLIRRYRAHTHEQYTLYLEPLGAKGKWSGQNPFGERDPLRADADGAPLAVLTRATIRPSKLRQFWQYVPTSELQLSQNSGLLFTKGIGEVPLLQMATFSVWRDRKALLEFAYRGKNHQGAIQRTRNIGWYREELFARFRPLRAEGTYDGVDPLSGVLESGSV